MAKPEDFERYSYGGNYDRKFYSDDTDKQMDAAYKQRKMWDRSARDATDQAIRREQAIQLAQ